MTEAAPDHAAQPRSAILPTLVSLFVVTMAFVLLASVGARQAAAGERVLGWFDPVVDLLRAFGQLLVDDGTEHARALGVLATSLAAATLIFAVFTRHQRAWPLLLLVGSLCLACWGQIELVQMHGNRGGCLYAAGAIAAVLFGIVSPAASLAQNTPARPFATADAIYLAGFSLVALLLRLYALPELPNLFNGEMIAPMLASRTFDGLRWYLPDGMLTNSTGIMHLGPQMLFYKLYGVSVYSLRLAAVLYGVVAVPLFYWLAQRFAGTTAAVIGTALLVTAPEQLFWSRLESTNFAPIPVLALITAHVGLSMVEKLSARSLVMAALCLPFGRYFYTAGSALVFYPWLQFVHALLFVRRAWRTTWYAVPILAAGTFLWVAAISIVLALVTGAPLALHNPAQHGELILRGAGEYSGFTFSQLIVLQATSAWNNLVVVIESLAYSGILSEWYQRDILVGSTTLMIPATVALVAVSLAYLVGQIQRPRAFAILLWVGLGLLPAVLSMQPTDRRFLLIFPALYLAVGVAGQAFMATTQRLGGGLATASISLLLAAWTVAGSLTGLSSHFRLPIAKTAVEDLIDFSKPIFAESDSIYFDTDSSWAFVFVFGNAERFLASPPCYRPVRVGEWLHVAADLPCEYQEESYKALFSAQRIEALRKTHDPRRITLLIDMNMPSRNALEMLKGLFPQAQVRTSSGVDAPQFVALTIDKADLDALRSPELKLGAQVTLDHEAATKLMAGTTLTLAPTAADNGTEAAIAGAMYVRAPGWYHVSIQPSCKAATLRVDRRKVSPESVATPMLAGLHSLDLTLAPLSACPTPLTIAASPLAHDEPSDEPPPTLFAPRTAAIESAAAPAVLAYDGYGSEHAYGDLPGTVVVDFGVDQEGEVITLLQGGGKLRARRLTPSGKELAAWDVSIPSYLPIWGVAVAPNGTSYVAAGGPVYAYDRDGAALLSWPSSPIYSAEIVAFADGRVLTPVSQENSLYMLKADGTIERKWRAFNGGPGVFTYPVAVTTDRAGTFAVLQGDNEVLLFRSPAEDFQAEFVGSFRVGYFEPPSPRRAIFDGPSRLLFSDPAGATLLAYQRDGVRMLATRPERDLTTRGFKAPVRMAATPDYLYVLDWQRHLWQLPRN